MKPEDYLPQNDMSYTVHYGEFLGQEYTEEEFDNADFVGLPSDEIDECTTRSRPFPTEEAAREYVAEYIAGKMLRGDLNWVAFIYIQKSYFTVIKDYTEWLAMS